MSRVRRIQRRENVIFGVAAVTRNASVHCSLPDGGEFRDHRCPRFPVVVVIEQHVRLAIVAVAYDGERFFGRHGQLQVPVRLLDHGHEPLELAVPVLFLVHQRPGAAHAQRLELVQLAAALDQPAVLVPLDLAQVADQLAEPHRVLLLGGERHAVEPAQRRDGHGQVLVVHVRAAAVASAGQVLDPGRRIAAGPRVLQDDGVLGPMGAALVPAVHEHRQRGRPGPLGQVFQQERHDVPVSVYLVVELPVGLEHGAQLFHGRLEFDRQPDAVAVVAVRRQPAGGEDVRQPLRHLRPGHVSRVPVRFERGRHVGRRAVHPVGRQRGRQPTL